ncbi:MAG: glycosyltransferase [Candidatus Electronema sp. VV]
MRILHLTTSFPLRQDSVSGVFIHRLICNFPPEVETIVLTPDSRIESSILSGSAYRLQTFRYAPKRWQILAHEPGGLPVALRSSLWHSLLVPFFFFSMLVHATRLARQSDVIHAHWTVNGIIAGIAGRLTGRPVVTTIRGEDASRIQTSAAQRFLLRICLKNSDAVAAVSKTIHEQFLAICPDSVRKLHFVPNGVDETFFLLSVSKQGHKPVILILGSLIPRKAVDVVLKAAAACKNKQWRMIIAGSGPEEGKLRDIAETEGISERVFFAGQVLPEDVPSLLAQADMLVQASHSEGRPNTVLEAMAAAVPVIGSDIDGINELIEDEKNGLLFPVGNAEALAEQLDKLLAAPEWRQQLGLASRKTLQEQNLTWDKCATAYLSLYYKSIDKEKTA